MSIIKNHGRLKKIYSLTWLLRGDQWCTCRRMTSNEIVSHTIQLKEKGCMLYIILNYYIYNTHGPSFWGDGIAHQVFISESRNSYTMKLSLDCEIRWILRLEE